MYLKNRDSKCSQNNVKQSLASKIKIRLYEELSHLYVKKSDLNNRALPSFATVMRCPRKKRNHTNRGEIRSDSVCSKQEYGNFRRQHFSSCRKSKSKKSITFSLYSKSRGPLFVCTLFHV